MTARDIPPDDLYARLELPAGAAPEAIEIAWRALLKRHHPDVAGEASLEIAKRINVAHDWLSDPELKARYDRVRNPPGRGVGVGATTPGGTMRRGTAPRRSAARPRRPRWMWPAETRSQAGPRRAGRPRLDLGDRRPPDLDIASASIQAFLDQVAGLNADELDRLALAEPPPIAFVASIRRFLTAERQAAIDAVQAAVAARLPAAAQGRPRIADAVTSVADLLVLDGFLADSLSDPF